MPWSQHLGRQVKHQEPEGPTLFSTAPACSMIYPPKLSCLNNCMQLRSGEPKHRALRNEETLSISTPPTPRGSHKQGGLDGHWGNRRDLRHTYLRNMSCLRQKMLQLVVGSQLILRLECTSVPEDLQLGAVS